MHRTNKHIAHLTLGILLVLLSVVNSTGQKYVPYYEFVACEAMELSIVDMQGDEYTWDFYADSSANFATEDLRLDPAIYFQDGDYRDSSTVRIENLPEGQYWLRIMAWDEVACTNNLMVFRVNMTKPYVYLAGDSACVDDPVELKIVLSGAGPWDVIYTDDGTNRFTVNIIGEPENTHSIPIMNPKVGVKEYWVMEVNDQGTGCISYPVPEKAKVHIFPIPDVSKIYVKDP